MMVEKHIPSNYFIMSFQRKLIFFSIWKLIMILPQQALSARILQTNAAIRQPAAALCAAAVNLHGYNCQEFEVITDDGYVLSVQRISEGENTGRGGGCRGNNSIGPPVLLQHGVLVDGMSWLVNSGEESLPLILADNGFDVWISNTRGTRFSRRHVSLKSSDPEYWDWTWDDLVTHELPSLSDLVFRQTAQKIHYVGHSMGTLTALAWLAEGGNGTQNIRSAAFLSPIAYLSHMNTPIAVLAAKAFLGEIMTAMFDLPEFNPEGEAVAHFLKALCAYPQVNCYDLLTSFTGKNCCLNESTVELFLKTEPQSTSTKTMIHFAQTVRDGKLSKYDYGNATSNMEHYGQTSPPLYDLSRIPGDVPLFLSYGGEDALADVMDVETLMDCLKMNTLQTQFLKDYAHADFIFGDTAKDLIYNQIVTFFRSLKQ